MVQFSKVMSFHLNLQTENLCFFPFPMIESYIRTKTGRRTCCANTKEAKLPHPTLNHFDLWQQPVPNCLMPSNYLASGNGPHQNAPSSLTEGISFCRQPTILSFFPTPIIFFQSTCKQNLTPRQWPTTKKHHTMAKAKLPPAVQ